MSEYLAIIFQLPRPIIAYVKDREIIETLSLDYSGTPMSPPRGILLSWQQDNNHSEARMVAEIIESSGRAEREKYNSIIRMY